MTSLEHELRIRREKYDLLVERRKKCSACPELVNPSQILGGCLDSAEVGPWSRWQGSLMPETIVVGQDFSDQNYFIREFGRDNPKSETNIVLKKRLNDLGYAISCGDKGKAHKLFFTNSVLCLKPPSLGMQGRLPEEYAMSCGRAFLKPLTEILKPSFIITLGEKALTAVLEANNLPRQPLSKIINNKTADLLPSGSYLFPVYHLSRRTRTVRSLDQQDEDWLNIKRQITKIRA